MGTAIRGSQSETFRAELIRLHFEQLTNADVAAILEMNESTASSRYLRALKRLKDKLSQYPGWFGG
jgi:DNA-directed RNA polymerase specialized sigma24 family protein